MAPLFLLLTTLASIAIAKNMPFASGDATGCISLSHIQALGQTFDWLNANSTSDAILPAVPDKYINAPSECIPESLYDLYFEPIVAMAKKEDLLSNLNELLPFVGGEHSVHKRARKCPEIQDAALKKASSLSCDSAPHPSACRSCASFSTINFVASCVACSAKANQESVFCCAAAATTFATYYSQVCLDK
ncbi:hypothetical protein NW767_015077 [Fusarium falciforme]|uniref:Uncharacterized protein n=1 Tax=Fusarium falciforme TaxID=195108 RepID=A0A9W8QTX6_9HYPO|nr:hypothetical protein NW755_014455 [Fusarium falciforme]KAJ4177616.1 hypothetical protein NW767_015077 [Fusarium falciforme]KAJ4180492.1 hypothetical protein NW759_017242 [Fusarium solani]KAJ4229744.1 hypothetical protein NW757_014058 [Fusarium falciforme]